MLLAGLLLVGEEGSSTGVARPSRQDRRASGGHLTGPVISCVPSCLPRSMLCTWWRRDFVRIRLASRNSMQPVKTAPSFDSTWEGPFSLPLQTEKGKRTLSRLRKAHLRSAKQPCAPPGCENVRRKVVLIGRWPSSVVPMGGSLRHGMLPARAPGRHTPDFSKMCLFHIRPGL